MLQSLKPSKPMAFWHSREFRRLYQLWEEKLRAENFEDAEEGDLDSRVLRQKASNVYRAAPATIREAKQLYFELLAERAQTAIFRNDIDQFIISLRSQGHNISEIAFQLQKAGCGRHIQTIRFVIRYYETLWGIKKWLPHQIRPRPKKG